jgi:hypothetical protein
MLEPLHEDRSVRGSSERRAAGIRGSEDDEVHAMNARKVFWLWVGAGVLAGLMVTAPMASAKNKTHKSQPSPPTDSIEVVGHIPPTNHAVTNFICTQHYSSYYLYAEHESGKDITLIDVTKTTQPAVLADVPYTGNSGSEALVAVAGTAALVSSELSDPPPAPPQSLKIMDFSDPQHPKVAREFAGVTAVGRDNQRGLVFVANSEGIWILQQNFALDPEVEAEYTRHVLYDH